MKRGNLEIDFSKIAKTNLEFEWVDLEKNRYHLHLYPNKLLACIHA